MELPMLSLAPDYPLSPATDLDRSLLSVWSLNKNIHHESFMAELNTFLCTSKNLVDARIQLRKHGVTRLHRAVIMKDYVKVKTLLNGDVAVDVNAPTTFGETPLYYAAYLGLESVVLQLLEAGARVTKETTADESELLGAVRAGQLSCAKILISHGSNVNVICEDWTPLHVACFMKSSLFIKLLIESGADVNAIGDWTYAPVNFLFTEYAKRERYIKPCYDEWIINRCLKQLLVSPELDANYWSRCALGNPPVLQRALVMLSPTLCRDLLNHGASADCLFDESQRCVHDELAMLSIRDPSIGEGLDDRVQRYQDCLELCIHHGVEPKGVGWLNTMRLLLRQLQNVPLNRSRPQMEPVFLVLLNYAKNPVSLLSLCRRVIRRAVGHPVSPKVESILCLAPRLKRYILMQDIGTDCLYSI